MQAALDEAAVLLDQARSAGIPVIHIQLCRDVKGAAPGQAVILTVHEMKRLARNAAELMTLADSAQLLNDNHRSVVAHPRYGAPSGGGVAGPDGAVRRKGSPVRFESRRLAGRLCAARRARVAGRKSSRGAILICARCGIYLLLAAGRAPPDPPMR